METQTSQQETRQGRRLEKILYIHGIGVPGEEVLRDEILRVIKKTVGKRCRIKSYESTREAAERENLSEFDVLIMDASDDVDRLERLFKIREGIQVPSFTEKFREANPKAYIVALSVEENYLEDDIAKILYDDRICTFDIECISSSLPRRIRQSLRDAGFELELGEEK